MHERKTVTFFDPATHAQALAYHAGIEKGILQRPILPAIAVEPMLETLEAEIIMSEAPDAAAV